MSNMSGKILYVPLDERPCNYYFPTALFGAGMDIVSPPADIMGCKKKPACFERLVGWLEKNAAGAESLVISIETLVFGGIVPSRVHGMSVDEIKPRFDVLHKLRENYPKLKIFAFSLILRCPQYSSDDEEPEYYKRFGQEIFLKGELIHKKELGEIGDGEYKQRAALLDAKIDKACYEDYIKRRETNLAINIMTLELTGHGIIDFCIIPQDDAAPYGFTAIDQIKIRARIKNKVLQSKALMYPGADEIGMILMARLLNEKKNRVPRVFVKYSAHDAVNVIPLYEDRTLGETVKYHITASGCVMWDNPDTADIILMVNAPSGNMVCLCQPQAVSHNIRNYDIERNLAEFCASIRYFCRGMKKPVALADAAYCNGGDIELIKILDKEDLLGEFAAYAGWNTSSNTIGTALSQAVCYLHFGKTQRHMDFLALRYAEDAAYCAKVRALVCDKYLPALNLDYFNAGGQRGKVAEIVKAEIEAFMKKNIPAAAKDIEITDCYMPWARMFEAGLTCVWKK